MSFRKLNILLVRHGESEGNIDKKVYLDKHDCEINLTELGFEQAAETGVFINHFLKQNGWSNTRFFASSYNRAKQTLQTIIDQLDPELQPQANNLKYDNRLRECEFGDLAGIEDEELKEMFPLFYARKKRDIKSKAKYFTRRPGGESPANVGDRCRDFAGSMVRDLEHSGIRNFVVVAHCITIRAFMQELLHAGNYEWYAEQKSAKNASVYLVQNKQTSKKFYDNIGAAKPDDYEKREGCIFIPKTAIK